MWKSFYLVMVSNVIKINVPRQHFDSLSVKNVNVNYVCVLAGAMRLDLVENKGIVTHPERHVTKRIQQHKDLWQS